MFADGLGLKGTLPIVISDIEYLMSRDVSDIWKFVLAEIAGEYFSVLIDEIFHQSEAEPLNHAAFHCPRWVSGLMMVPTSRIAATIR